MDIDTTYLTSLARDAVSSANGNKLKDKLTTAYAASSSGKGAEVTSEEDAKLLDACKEFESYFVEQMYKEMLKTVPKDELDSGSNEMLVDYFKEELVKEYASETAGQGSLGLAQTLYEQMKRNIGITPEEADARAAEKAAGAQDIKETADSAD